jgi:hypothetical protein
MSYRSIRAARCETARALLATLDGAERDRMHPILWWDYEEHGFPKPSVAVLRWPSYDMSAERMTELLRLAGYTHRMAYARARIGRNGRE